MIKLLRQGAIDKPWFFRTLMFLIALAFVVSMGWFGFSRSDQAYVAQIDEIKIPRKEYRQAYANAYRVYRNLLAENFDEENLKKLVINDLIQRRLWLNIGDQMGITISSKEIADALIKDRSFFRKDRFDPEQYRFVLANSRPPLTPEKYESALREDLLVEKVQSVIRDGIILTEQETVEAKATVMDQDLSSEKKVESENTAIRNALRQKRQRALSSYIQAVHSNSSVEIQDWLL
jgi:hypothetical protein